MSQKVKKKTSGEPGAKRWKMALFDLLSASVDSDVYCFSFRDRKETMLLWFLRSTVGSLFHFRLCSSETRRKKRPYRRSSENGAL